MGGDWFSYINHLERARGRALLALLFDADPGYAFLNFVTVTIGGEIWIVNSICGLLFSIGLLAFVRTQPLPWLALVCSIPYLVVVVAMGYTRQGVAIGLVMLGMASYIRGGAISRVVVWTLLGAMFHRSAVLLIPAIGLTVSRGRMWTYTWLGIAAGLAYVVLLADDVDDLVRNYIEAEYQSEGAAIRIAMNAVPAGIFLAFRKRFPMQERERPLWTGISMVAIGFIPAMLIVPSTTALDRLALYVIPIQMVVLSRIPLAFAQSSRAFTFLRLGVILYSGTVLWVWLNFAGNASGWLPFRLYPL